MKSSVKVAAARQETMLKNKAIVAAAAKGAMVDAGDFNKLFFENARPKAGAIRGAPLSKRTRVTFECEEKQKRDGTPLAFHFSAFVGGKRVGGICESVTKVGALIGKGPTPKIKKAVRK